MDGKAWATLLQEQPQFAENCSWDKLTEKLGHSISDSHMDMYIRQITPVRLENDVIYCTVPSTKLCSAVQQNYFSLISALLNDITNNSNMRLELQVDNQKAPLKPAGLFLFVRGIINL